MPRYMYSVPTLQNGISGITSDMFLKHGTSAQGEWTTLGILDALPDASPDPVARDALSDSVQNLPQLAANLGRVARIAFGRPAESYGITSLLMWRPIAIPL
jgi:hypothetical protein